MTSEMRTCPQVPLTELLSFVVDNRGKTVPTAEAGHVLIATNCIKNESLYPIFEKVRYLSNETYRTWFRSHPQPGDIIFVNKGTPGRVCMVPNPVNFCIAQDMIALRVDESKVYNKYLFAVLRGHEIQTQIYNTNVGDVIPHFKKSFLDQLLVPLPSMEIQRGIGDMYFALSEKADNNSKINHHLYELLQSYFCWFRNESNENVYGTISQICSYSNSRISVETLTLNSYYSTENMLPNKAGSVAASSLPSMSLTTKCTAGDTLVSNIRPYFKKIFFCEKECGCSTDVLCFKPIDEWLAPYLFCVFYDDKFFDYMMAGSKGTKMPRGDKQQIMNYRIVIPPLKDRKDFAEFAMPILEQIKKNEHEIQMLSSLRDTLLPKLMSGEIDVSKINI